MTFNNVLINSTFPGTILHELSHEIICYIRNIKVIRVRYFQINSMDRKIGFVEHEAPTRLIDSFLISFSPLLLIPISILLYSLIIIFKNVFGMWSQLIIIWLAFSIGSQSLPSKRDLDNIYYKCIYHLQLKEYSSLIYLPVIHAAYICSSLTVVWFNYIFSIGLYYLTVFIINS
jgi:hypothetical protein